jgi:hypothetical protein
MLCKSSWHLEASFTISNDLKIILLRMEIRIVLEERCFDDFMDPTKIFKCRRQAAVQ